MGKTVGLTFPAAKVDEKDEKYTCPICGKEYKTEKGLQEHIADKHPDGAGE